MNQNFIPMKKQMMSLLAVLLIGWGLHAQPEGRNPQEMAQRVTDEMADKLELNEAQKAKALEANLIHITQMEELRSKREKDREQAEAVMKAHEEKMKAILTPEQFEQFKKGRDERFKKMRHKRERMDRDREMREMPMPD